MRTFRVPSRIQSPSQQRGVAVLLVAVVMAIVMGIIAFTTSRSGMMEQRITGNDIRAREAHEAAQAGLEYGVAWALKSTLPLAEITCATGSLPTGCPPSLSNIAAGNTSSGEQYAYTLTFDKSSTAMRVRAVATGVADATSSAAVEAYVRQVPFGLFGAAAPTPPPWVMAGCITTAPTGTPDAFILSVDSVTVTSGTSSSAACLPQGHLDVNLWEDANEDGFMSASEEGGGAAFNRGSFSGCPGLNCAWNNVFEMSLPAAKTIATNAGQTYAGSIPCGPAAGPGVYLINNPGPINSGDITGSCSGPGLSATTIGAPGQPIVLIVPSSSGCPKFNGGVTIYGFVYYENTTACAANGWGGATIYGSVIWEGNVDKPNANSKFIEMNYENLGDLNEVFGLGVDYTTSIPGTWKDFQ